MNRKTRAMTAALWGILVTSSHPGYAQTPTVVSSETVTGVARDALQRPLDSVQIRLETPDGKVIARGTTQKNGKYTLPTVAPGVYSLIGEKTGFATATAVVTVGAKGVASDLTLASNEALDMKVAAERLAAARSETEPRIGATTYTLDNGAIQDQPGGSNIPLNQTLLQAPDVSQDSFGQIHLRNDHANIQYRINGVILPEGISFFGQSLSSRFASSVDLITGSLPAQYGLVTTGIVDIQTKSGAFEPGGSVGFYGGSHGWMEPSLEYAGSAGNLNYYISGDLLQNGIGIENPTSSSNPIHDQTRQGHGFAYLEDIIDPTSKISLILGAYQGSFQIPNSPGQAPAFQYLNQTNFNSTLLNDTQQESNDYAALSYLKTEDNYSFQISAFTRYSRLAYSPDDVGDLMFFGLAQNALRTDVAEGLQADASYKLNDSHTLRYGGLVTAEHAASNTNSQVFPCLDLACSSVGTSPTSVNDSSAITGWTYSAYAQDEWKLLPTVTLNYGARFDVLNAYTNTNQLSPRVNVVWKPTSDTTLHAGYSRYFTPPALELVSGESIAKFAGTTGYPAGYTPASPPADGAILPERSNYFDIGADHTFAPGLKLGVDAFYKIAQDLIDEGQFGAPIILSVFNYAHADVYGIEFTGSYKRGNWSAYGNLSVGRERATQVASQQFNFTPAQLAFISSNYIYTDHSQWVTASGGIAYTWLGTRFSADMIYGSGLRQDSGDIPNGGTVPGYTQVNLGVSHRFQNMPGGPIELSLNLMNVSDSIYEIRSGTGVGVFAPQYGPRRAIYAGIRKFF
ncbi:TonB-dependent receptor [Acidisphaera sp. S103]|uniref:TonB-dependent receptor n=1 Tax=Acidisphaera sp. S103 TaxID=1747223 RepID=UPI00131E27DD|nr:TonB-dependent receptor [Acidisphaera sp. S103]